MLNIYTIHVKNNNFNNAVLIKEGNFCLAALIFSIFWAIYHRMWFLVIILLSINIFIGYLMSSQILTDIGGTILQFCINILLSFFAYDLRRVALAQKDYEMVDIIRGNSILEAQYNWLDYKELAHYDLTD